MNISGRNLFQMGIRSAIAAIVVTTSSLALAAEQLPNIEKLPDGYDSSEKELSKDPGCGTWLCLPVGFLYPGCGDAYKDFWSRVLHIPQRPPAPSFSYCSVDGESNGFEQHMGEAALINSDARCPGTGSMVGGRCFVTGTRCYQREHNEGTDPKNCIASYGWAMVTQHGEPIGDGEPFFWVLREPGYNKPGCNGDPTVPDC